MAKLLEVVTYKETCMNQVKGVDAQPNVVSFCCQFMKTQEMNQERALFLVKMELTRDGKNCKIAIQSMRDHQNLA